MMLIIQKRTQLCHWACYHKHGQPKVPKYPSPRPAIATRKRESSLITTKALVLASFLPRISSTASLRPKLITTASLFLISAWSWAPSRREGAPRHLPIRPGAPVAGRPSTVMKMELQLRHCVFPPYFLLTYAKFLILGWLPHVQVAMRTTVISNTTIGIWKHGYNGSSW